MGEGEEESGWPNACEEVEHDEGYYFLGLYDMIKYVVLILVCQKLPKRKSIYLASKEGHVYQYEYDSHTHFTTQAPPLKISSVLKLEP